MPQPSVALVGVASVASQSRPAQLEVGRIVDPVVCTRLLYAGFQDTSCVCLNTSAFANSLLSNGALKVLLALARPAHTMSSVTQSSSQAGNGTAFVQVSCCVRPSFSSAYGFPVERAAVHQQFVALVRVASLEFGRIVNPVPRARLLDRLLFDMPIFAGSRPSNGALRATFALAKPTHKTMGFLLDVQLCTNSVWRL